MQPPRHEGTPDYDVRLITDTTTDLDCDVDVTIINVTLDHERVVHRYLSRMLVRNLSERTISHHGDVLRRVRRWHGGPILYLTHEDLTQWQEQRASQVQPVSLRNELGVLRSFFAWALREDLIAVDPTARIDAPRVGRRLPRPISDARFAYAMEQADDVMRAILGLAGWAGLRAVEISRLSWSDVNLADRTVRVIGKGDKEAVAPIPPDLVAVLESLRHRSGPVIPRRDGQRDLHNLPHTISHHANNYLHSLGMEETLHRLRHMFGTNILRATGNLRVAQEALRHESPTSTAVYTLVDVRDVRAAVDLAAEHLGDEPGG